MRRPALALVAALALAGCDGFSDFVDDPLGDFVLTVRVADIAVELGDEGLPVAVVPGQPSTSEGTVRLDLDVDRIEAVEAVELTPADFTFDPVVAGSGTVRVAIRLSGGGGVIEVAGPVEIVDGEVVEVFEVPASALGEATLVLGSREVDVRIDAELTRAEDPNAPPAGTLTVLGYSATVLATA